MSFADTIAQFASDTKKKQERVRQGATMELFETVTKRTPVGNPALWKYKPKPDYKPGRLKGNWQTSLNAPLERNDDPVDPSGRRTLSRMRRVVRSVRGDTAIYFTNNVPYARRIEFEGHSKQAPSGMARLTMAGANGVVRKHAQKS